MVKKILIIFLIFIIGIILIYFIASQFFKTSEEITFESEEVEEVGQMGYLAPHFTLLNLEGEEIRTSDYKDKIIILNFWTTWNLVAKDQLVILESYYQEIKDNKDIVLLTINNQEDKSVVSSFIRRGEYVLPVLLDENGKIGQLYKISTLPATYFINQEGKVKEIYIGVLNQEEIKKKVERLYLK